MRRKKPESAVASPLDEARWQIISCCDAGQDGAFVYAVRSTGVFCKPSCSSRQPLRRNVQFFDTPGAAAAAGFRACKRCRPEDSGKHGDDRIARVCRIIEKACETPDMQTLAREAALSVSRFQRVFKTQTGLTPGQYIGAVREQRLRGELQAGNDVTQAIYNAGYGSAGRFYESADRVLGMKASRYRAGGNEMSIQFAVGQCSLGAVLVAESERGICAIYLGDDPQRLANDLQDQFPQADINAGNPAFDEKVARVVGFVEAPELGLNLPLDIRGTVFQKRVWDALCRIPIGRTASYRDIAERIGSANAVRAVAGACAANRLAVAIPCHRVVRSDGSLSGYRWGVERKHSLLVREATPVAKA